MSKRALKYGGKSGILPRVRPVFKRNPIRPKTNDEIAEESKIEQGYAEGIPLPKKRGFKFQRQPVPHPVVTVEERIKRNIEDRSPAIVNESELSHDELWKLKRDEIRRVHLKDAYITEAKRLQRIEELKAEKEAKEKEAKKDIFSHEETEATRLTLPTIDSYLSGPIMRQRTEEEKEILEEKRILNREVKRLEVKEKKANEILELYHAASKFITTEEELDHAIKEAFEVNVSKFERNQLNIENKLQGYSYAFANANVNEGLVLDEVLGEINGEPGLETVKHTLDGEIERLRREAQLAINQKMN
ncbi:uncharacterized protein PRCAT00001041001 [Priceomyces carsonii]|uniref:uncharacterized protein n=1 Tax=Priceomyces carsonii TaxID=28549 RepID=UPI002EDABD45|nr:unnamed protein product [Priceomyces carsonii]